MGVDYDGVGGIGIEFTEELIQKFISKGIFSQEDWEDDYDKCFSKIGITYTRCGNEYSGDITYYFVLKGNNLKEVIDNAPEFIEKFKKFDMNLTFEDLIVIEDIHVS